MCFNDNQEGVVHHGLVKFNFKICFFNVNLKSTRDLAIKINVCLVGK
jgi:hypothetical protein